MPAVPRDRSTVPAGVAGRRSAALRRPRGLRAVDHEQPAAALHEALQPRDDRVARARRRSRMTTRVRASTSSLEIVDGARGDVEARRSRRSRARATRYSAESREPRVPLDQGHGTGRGGDSTK